MDLSDGCAPEISYPCRWAYRVVGESEPTLRALILHVCAGDEHEIHSARPSRAGTYVSVHVSVIVRDETHRKGVYTRLAEADAVKFVL